MAKQRRTFNAEDLEIVATGESFQCDLEPPIAVGSVVYLNSGSPRLLVVDLDGESATVAWRAEDGSIQEMSSNRVCFHRARDI